VEAALEALDSGVFLRRITPAIRGTTNQEEKGPFQNLGDADEVREAIDDRLRKRNASQREVIELTAEGSRAFVEALADPPEPNENLRRLSRESRLARPPTA
jgi:hypothetical protein